MIVKSKNSSKQGSKHTRQDWLLKLIPLIALFLKLVTATNIKGVNGMTLGAWLGADGESYLNGLDGLLSAVTLVINQNYHIGLQGIQYLFGSCVKFL